MDDAKWLEMVAAAKGHKDWRATDMRGKFVLTVPGMGDRDSATLAVEVIEDHVTLFLYGGVFGSDLAATWHSSASKNVTLAAKAHDLWQSIDRAESKAADIAARTLLGFLRPRKAARMRG